MPEKVRGRLDVRTDILEYLQREVYTRCEKPENRFGMGCYYHIEAVVKNAGLLAQPYGADREIVMIAAWLHDIASITDYDLYPQHHIHGAEMARQILSQLSYDESGIRIVQDCIRNHRGSVSTQRLSAEEICVADADAVSHFDGLPSLLYLAFVERGMNLADGVQFVREKLERSYHKLSPAGRDFYQEKYRQAMEILSNPYR